MDLDRYFGVCGRPETNGTAPLRQGLEDALSGTSLSCTTPSLIVQHPSPQAGYANMRPMVAFACRITGSVCGANRPAAMQQTFPLPICYHLLCLFRLPFFLFSFFLKTESSHVRQLADPSEIPGDFEVIPLSSSPTSQYADAVSAPR